MTYIEMKDAVIKALADNNREELKHLSDLDGRWFDDIIEELKEGA